MDALTKETLLELLKEHLTIDISLDTEYGSYGSGDMIVAKVKIKFDGEEIADAEDFMRKE